MLNFDLCHLQCLNVDLQVFNDWFKKAGEWAAELGYSTTPLQLHENGIVLKNDKSFPFRVYIWFTDDDCASDKGHLRQECNKIHCGKFEFTSGGPRSSTRYC